MTGKRRSSIHFLAGAHRKPIMASPASAVRETCVHRDQGTPVFSNRAQFPRQTSAPFSATDWQVQGIEPAEQIPRPIASTATATSLSVPRREPESVGRGLGADELARELRHANAPPVPHFLDRRDVKRLPLNVDDEPAETPLPRQASHDVFETLRRQFTHANTFNLGRFNLDEHFSHLEGDIDAPVLPKRHEAPVAGPVAALSESEVVTALAVLSAETKISAPGRQIDDTAPDGPETDHDDSHNYIDEQSAHADQDDEEHVMARSLFELDRAISGRQAPQLPPSNSGHAKPNGANGVNGANGANGANGPRLAPSASQAIANAQSRARRSAFVRGYPAAFSAIDTTVPGDIKDIRQPDGMSCWATVYTMLHGWKTKNPLSIRDALTASGKRWLDVFNAGTGLMADEKTDFLNDVGLVARPPQSHSIEGWRDLLATYGPLWVTTDEDPSGQFAIHARLLYRMHGDGTPGGTTMYFVDPGDGKRHSESFAAFMEKYESEARDPGRPLRIQIVHWQSGARSMSVRGYPVHAFTSRGVRNNNPGNLRISDEAWEGKVPRAQNTDGAFEQFTSYAYGVRALIKLLRNYIKKGIASIGRIVTTYAPPKDHNHTENYINFVLKRLTDNGVTVDRDSALTPNRKTLRLLCQAIARMENGVEAITDAQFDEGFALLSAADQEAIGQSLSAYNYYYGFGESEAENTEGDEREDSGLNAMALEATVPSFCTLNRADDAHTDHFRLSEFHSHDGVEVPTAVRGNVQGVMRELEVLRVEVGKPIRIVSGFRSAAHNKSVGGADRSKHLCGMAADIKIDGMMPTEIHSTIERLISAGHMKQGGLGLYRTFVHYDTRGTKARWDNT
jgi:hypothetical protein